MFLQFRKRTSDDGDWTPEVNNKKLRKAEPPAGPSAALPAAVKRNSIQNFFKKLNPDVAKNSCPQTQNSSSDDSGPVLDEKTAKISQVKDLSEELATTNGQKSNGDCDIAAENLSSRNTNDEISSPSSIVKKKKNQVIESDSEVSVDVDEFVNHSKNTEVISREETVQKTVVRPKKAKKVDKLDSDSDITVDLDESNSPKKPCADTGEGKHF